jgi:ZIP family zinc transporter
MTLAGGSGISVPLLAGVFLSNLPEAMAATAGLVKAGWPDRKILFLWLGVVLASGASAAVGYVLAADAHPTTIAFVLSFAAGAILTMLADTMMPEAFEHGGRLVGIFTTIGFAVAFGLSVMG